MSKTRNQLIYKETICNDAGEGFLHEASCVCCGVRDLTEAKGIANGYGVITDQDNDKVFFHQKRREAPAFMPGMDRRWARRARCPRAQQYLRSTRALNGRGSC